MISLVTPDVRWHREWLDMMSEMGSSHVDGASVADADIARMADPGTFAEWVTTLGEHELGRNLPDDRAACTTRWLGRHGELVGTVNLRHELTDFLRREGGHIGYAVRPSARRQGVASEGLGLMLDEAARLGVNPVLICCRDANVASARTIERAGGVLEDVVEGTRRYWVTIPGTPLGYAVGPLRDRPLRGRLVTLRLPSRAEIEAMRAGERQPDWAEGFPRQDDLDASLLVADTDGPDRAWGNRLVQRRCDGLVVGTLGFLGPSDAAGEVEIGYGLVESAQGEGLITDALRLAVPAAEASGARVRARTAYDNVPSLRALRRAGFSDSGERDPEGLLVLRRAKA
jgi:predicted acetyltransferase